MPGASSSNSTQSSPSPSPSAPTSSQAKGRNSAQGTPSHSHKASTDSKISKTRLTPHQKNTNHKDAENKRRNAIRDQFLALSHIVPGAEGQERSEFVMLQKTVAHLKEVMNERRGLIAKIESRGGRVANELRLGDEEWGGKEWKTNGVDEWEKSRGKRGDGGIDGEADDDDG